MKVKAKKSASSLTVPLSFIGSWLSLRYENTDIPGFVVAIAHKGKLLFNRAYGYANLEKKGKLTPKHIFRVASHSKTFTATAIMQLKEKGKLRIDDYVIDYLPWLNKHKNKQVAKITIRQLLSHSAGLIRDGLDKDYWQFLLPFPNKVQLQRAVLEADLVFEPNDRMKYSNFGYGLLGMVIEAVSGQPYEYYVKKNIIEPLKLVNTGPDYVDQIKTQLVTGYTRKLFNKERRPIANTYTNALAAATGFYSTSQDLCKYFSAHFIDSRLLLNNEAKKEMQHDQWLIGNTRQYEAYGLGFKIEYARNRRVFGHGGSFPGQITRTMCDAKNELVVTVLTNCGEADTDSIIGGIFSVFDFFEGAEKKRTKGKSKNKLAHFNGRFASLASTMEIVSTNSKIVAIWPNSWWPFSD